MVLVLPSGSDEESLAADLGTTLFERLGFFDRIATSDHTLWKRLRRRYSWAGRQHLPISSDRPDEALAGVRAFLEAESDDPRSGKALHGARAAVLGPRFAAARGHAPLDVLEVGARDGRWAWGFDPAQTRFFGAGADEGSVEAARADSPDGRFELLGPDLLLPYDDESFDLVFSVAFMHRHPVPAKRTLLSEMWRVTRPAGRLLFLEDFVVEEGSSGSAPFPTSISQFVDLLTAATAGRVELEDVESFRYPREGPVRGGVLSLSRLGAPQQIDGPA